MGKNVNVLIYGKPAAGKTMLAATAQQSPLTAPALFGDFEQGTLTLHDQHINKVDVPDLKTFNELLRFAATDTKYRTIIFDSLNSIHRMFMQDEIANQRKEDMRAVYGKSSERLVNFLLRSRSLNKHTIFTAWAKDDAGDDTRPASEIAPALPGQLAQLLPGYVDFVFHLSVEKRQGVTQRVLRTGMDGARLAKDRTHLLPAEMINPTFPQIVQIASAAFAGARTDTAEPRG